jgi:hypothetical protein
VASRAVGKTLGIAPEAEVFAVKCWDDIEQARDGDIVAGFEWVVNVASRSGKPSVLNLSWNTEPNTAFTRAAESTISAGIQVVGSSGNYGEDSRSYFPAGSE